MRNIYTKILFIIFVAFAASSVNAQDDFILKVDTIKVNKTRIIKIVTVRTLPKFILHVNVGLNTGAMELTSHNGGFSREDINTGKNFSARNGYGFNVTGKIPLNKKGTLWLDVLTGFDRFQSNLFADNDQDGKVYYNSINTGVGLEYNFTATHKVKYFIGLTPLLSFISGHAEMLNPDNNRVNVDFKTSARLGYQAFIGLEYAFDKNFGINMGMRFTHANLLLKNTEEPVEDETGTSPTSTVPLNDDATAEPIQFAGWKQFAYFTGSVGFSYFFGTKVRRYKIP